MQNIVCVIPGARRPPLRTRIWNALTRKRTALSVRDAIAGYKLPEPATVFSHFSTEIRDADGNLKYSHAQHYRHNLTTDTASGYTNRRDWQSKAMGGGLAPVATMTGTASATGATSMTNGSATFPTAGQALAGCIVVVGPNASGTGAISFATILSNTATVLTVDKWYSGGTWGTGTTPNATGLYTVLPGQMPAMFLAVTASVFTPNSADITLVGEATTNGFSRALATWAHTAAATTYTQQVVFTATGPLTVNNECVSGSATALTGVMPFESAEPTPPSMLSGDTLTQLVTITIN